MHVCTCVEARGLQEGFFETGFLLPAELDRLSGEPQGSTHLHLPSVGITRAGYHTPLFYLGSGDESCVFLASVLLTEFFPAPFFSFFPLFIY